MAAYVCMITVYGNCDHDLVFTQKLYYQLSISTVFVCDAIQ